MPGVAYGTTKSKNYIVFFLLVGLCIHSFGLPDSNNTDIQGSQTTMTKKAKSQYKPFRITLNKVVKIKFDKVL